MKSLKALKQRRIDLIAQSKAILDSPAGENGVLTDEQRAADDKIKGELTAISGDLQRMEAQVELERGLPAPATRESDSDPDAEVERAAARPQGFESLAEMFIAARAAADPDRRYVDPRLVYVNGGGKVVPATPANLKAAATGMNEGSGPEGGFLVEKQKSTELMKRAHDIGQIYRRVRTLPVGPNANGWKGFKVDEVSRANGSRWGGITVFWTPEGGLKQPSMPALAPWEIGLNKITGLVYVTDELLQDAVGLEGLLREAFPEELNFAVEDSILFGTGAGQPLGFVNSGIAVVVAAEGGQAADSVVYENVLNMLARFDPRSLPTAVWLYNQALFPFLAKMSFTPAGGTSVPVFMPANGASGSPYGTLFGIPMIPHELASAPGDLGDIMLVDFAEYLLITKGGVKTDVSMHVRFIYDETAFRFVLRVGGAPKWDAPLTPKNGTATVSPFVLLAAR
ncbi:MAG TPA: phage major capsid protein [Conexibacter sp.]|nr:phage major capsid protein [Conexibacter sp.]